MAIQLVYMTMGDTEEARRIGRALIESRLAACVNLIAPMHALYRWQGKIQEDQEVVMIAKTTSDRVSQLKEKVVSLHSYECPCVVCLPIEDGHGPFLDWIREQVAWKEKE